MSNPSFNLKSMTAYGRSMHNFAYGSFTVEIQSVNRRHLEVNINLPRLLARFEIPIRKKIAERVGRGMVNVLINWRSEAKSPVTVTPNLTLAKGVKTAWETIAYELGLETKVDLSLLSQEKDILLFEEELQDEASFQDALDKSVSTALDHLLEMKVREGEVLGQDINERLNTLEQVISKVESCAPSVAEKFRQKLTERLEELFEGKSPDLEERILREVALYSERVDITEEVVRFKSHIEQVRLILIDPVTTKGKSLDFLIQELNREINTVGSKASELEITQQVVKAKGELEKIREQVQNIE